MAEQDGQEKTEAPTERKREKAREDGQVASSKELPSAALLAAATLSFMVMGQNLLTAAQSMFAGIMMEPIREDINGNALYDLMGTSFTKILTPLIPLAILLFVVAVAELRAFVGSAGLWSPTRAWPRLGRSLPLWPATAR